MSNPYVPAGYVVPAQMANYYGSPGTAPATAQPVVDIPGTPIPIPIEPFPIPGLPGGSGGLKNPITSIGQVGDIIGKLMDPKFWRRVGQGALGVMLVLAGLYLMVSESNAMQRAKANAETAATVAAVA